MIKENCKVTLLNRSNRLTPASDLDICTLMEKCNADPGIHYVGDVARVIANLGLTNLEFAEMRFADINLVSESVVVGGCDRKGSHPQRLLPLRPKVRTALLSLHERNPESPFILGNHPFYQFRKVIRNMKSLVSGLSRGRLTLHSLRMNFAYRLFSSGLPMSSVRYCLGLRSDFPVLNEPFRLSTTKLKILRRDLESFLPEL